MIRFFATCPIGLEDLLTEELAGLGATEIKRTIAGVHFSAPFATAWRILMWSRLASRLLYPLASFQAPSPEELYRGIAAIDWSQHMLATGSMIVDVRLSRSTISHARFAAQKVKDAVVDQFRQRCGQRPSVDNSDPDLRLNVQLKQDRASLSIDLGGSLAQRGYRREGGGAPLRENLAAAILIRAGWPEQARSGGSLLDPLCGSGTLLIEGAMMAADMAPGLSRACRFGWMGFDADAWAAVTEEARERCRQGKLTLPPVLGFDADERVLAQARNNIERAGLTEHIEVTQRRLEDWESAVPSSKSGGLLVTNPPYGERMGEIAELSALYAQLGSLLRDHHEGWHAAVFTGRPQLGKQMGIRTHKRYKLFNGPLPCELLCFQVSPDWFLRTDGNRKLPLARGGAVIMGDGAQMFANRLKKNVRRLRKWAGRQKLSCYRIYDADMPEYNVAVDIYEDHALITEYPAPTNIPQQVSRNRLHDVMLVAPEVLGIPRERVVFRDPEAKQQTPVPVNVRVDGLRFEIDLRALGGALPPDLRPVHHLIRDLAKDKRFLHLHAGSGIAGVYARKGGARSTTSVEPDLVLLERARTNMDRNAGLGPAHRFHRAEPLQWLQEKSRFDLILFTVLHRVPDGRGQTLHPERDQRALIEAAAAHLTPSGILLFLVRHRKFKLDDANLAKARLQAEEITQIPEDCTHHQYIHRCFKVTRRS